MEFYIVKIILKSKNIYILWNDSDKPILCKDNKVSYWTDITNLN